MDQAFIDFLARFGHIVFGITWIGLLYYFNFVQTEYFKEADPDARTDAFSKLAPRALWWFRWGAMFTFLTGLIMLGVRGAGVTLSITIGSVLGTLMFLNVWLIIWPNQKKVLGMVEASPEEVAKAKNIAFLASRSNTLMSIPMVMSMVGAGHGWFM